MSERGFVGWPSAALLLAASCAPLGDLRPPAGPLPGTSYEVGAGAVRLGPRPYVEEPASGSGQLWASADVGRWVTLTGLSAFDTSAAAVGGAARLNALRRDRVAAGAEGQIGYAWGALVVPAAVRLVDQSWLYTSPRLGTLGRELSFSLPVGASVRVVQGFSLRAEWQVSWADFKYYNRRTHLALGAAYRW